MTTLVVGLGLLGGHLVTRLRRAGEDVRTVAVPWSDPLRAREALLEAARVAADADPDWRLAWCAGAGVVATPAAAFAAEVELFGAVLDAVDPPPAVLLLASSAGGVYAGSPDRPPYTERSATRALAPYGEAKLAMEQQTRRPAARGTRVVLARISNLYGPGQDLTKPQGLVSQLCLTQVTQKPLGVYVSMDTLRDYLYAEDAAALVAACLDRAADEPAGTVVTKILASGRATSIGELVDTSTRVFRSRPHLRQRPGSASARQTRDLRMRSEVWTDLDRLARTPLLVGLRATADDLARLHATGRLVPGPR